MGLGMNKKNICFIRNGSIAMAMPVWRNYFEYFAKTFENVFFLDISRVFTTSLRHGGIDNAKGYDMLPSSFKIVSPGSLSECRRFLRSNDMVAVCAFSETWEDWYIHYYLKKYSIPLIYILTISEISNFHYNVSENKPFFIKAFRKFRFFIYSRFRHFIIPRIFLSKVDTLFISNKGRAENLKDYSRYKEIIVVNSKFYDTFLSNKHSVSNDCVVFLDSMPPYHGDQFIYGHERIDRKLYYENLSRVFDIIESVTGKEVVVCLHPKYDENNLKEDFGQRKTYKYRTDEFVAKADMVLFHETSSVYSAILYEKKVIQILGSEFNDFINKNCESYQELFSFSALDMYKDSKERIKEVIRTADINHEKYEEFLRKYIIASGKKEELSCAQIADYITHKYGIAQKIK